MESRSYFEDKRMALLGLVLVLAVSAACSASNMVTKMFGSGGSIDDRIQDVEDELNPEGCFTRGEQFDEYWENTKLPDLFYQGKTCATGNLAAYRNCLKGKVIQEGMCIEEAEMACSAEFADLPTFLGAEEERIPIDPTHSDAIEDTGYMDVDGLFGVEGLLWYDLKDAHLCTIGVEAYFRGGIYDDTCSLKGDAELNILYEGSACASVCSSGPDSDTPCPVTRSGRTTWQATVTWDDATKKWIISGGIGCEDENSPGCAGFRGVK